MSTYAQAQLSAYSQAKDTTPPTELEDALDRAESLVKRLQEIRAVLGRTADRLFGSMDEACGATCEPLPHYNDGLTGNLLRSFDALADAVSAVQAQAARLR